MASAVLDIEKRRYTLKQGIYVISGSNAREGGTEFILNIENDSVDGKHAVIIWEAEGLVVFDLDSRVGTFVNEKRLPSLSKCKISKDVSIRFGTVEGKLLWCSTLEPQDSSGFHDDSLHLALDQTSEVNLTIPETQFFNPDQCVNADATKNNFSLDISIPETQDMCEPPLNTMTAQKSTPKEVVESSQFCISSQELNDCLIDSVDSNSRDVLENINWLISDEQPTAIKLTGQQTNNINDEELLALEAPSCPIDARHPRQEEEETNVRTHTPDLFDVELLQEFDKREMRMNNAKANRLNNEDEYAKKNTSKANSPNHDELSSFNKNEGIQGTPPGAATTAESTSDTLIPESKDKPPEVDLFGDEHLGEERQENALCIGSPFQHSNKENMIMGAANRLNNEDEYVEKNTSKAHSPNHDAPSSLNKNDGIQVTSPGAATTAESTTDSLIPESKDKPPEVDLFGNEHLGDQRQENALCIGSPLQHSNKENMVMGASISGDLEPTQVFISNKGNKAATTEPFSSSISLYGSLVGSDLEPPLSKDKPPEVDLFGHENLGEERQENALCIGSPLQHSNKESKIMGAVISGDLEPTQVFISNKGNKAATTEPSSSSTSLYGSLVGSDLEPPLSKDKPPEVDLFGDEHLGEERQENALCIGSPLQHSNKENMVMGASISKDLEPTQAFISNKGIKAAKTERSSSSTSLYGSLVGSDLEPTQVFVSKKQKDANSFKLSIPTTKAVCTDENDLVPTQLFVPKQTSSSASKTTSLNSTMLQCDKDEDAKKSVKSFFEERECDLQDDQQSSDLVTVTPDKESYRNPNDDANIMKTPEIISDAFSGVKAPDTAARREYLSRPEHNLGDEDSLTRFLIASRYRTDFDHLIKSFKSVQENSSENYNKETDKLLETYIDSNAPESPEKKSFNTTVSKRKGLKFESAPEKSEKSEKTSISSTKMKNKVENEPEKFEKTDDWLACSSSKGSEVSKTKREKERKKEAIKKTDNSVDSPSEISKRKLTQITDDTKASPSIKKSEVLKTKSKTKTKPEKMEEPGKLTTNPPSHNLSNKRNASNEPTVDNKRPKRVSADSKSSSSDVKPTDGNRRHKLKRGASVEEGTIDNRKIMKLSKDSCVNYDDSNASSIAVDKIKGQTKTVPHSLKESEQSVHTRSRSRKTSKSNSTCSAPSTSKAASNAIESEKSKKESETVPDTGKRLRTSKRLVSQTSNTLNYKDVDIKELPIRITRSRNPSIDINYLSNPTVPQNAPKQIKSREGKSVSIQKQGVLSQSKDLEHNSSIIPVQGQRRSSTRMSVSSGHSQEAQLKNINTDERPTTSRAAARSASNSSKPPLKIAFTMVDPQKQDELLRNSKNKWVIVSDPKDCEVLVMDEGNRTLKFLIAVAKGIPIVTTKWLEAIEQTGTISVRSNYFFKDTAFERSFKFSLLHTLNEAKRAKLFTNFKFLFTTNIIPTSCDMQAIVICAGGTILDKDHIPEVAENQELYLVSSKKDRHLWHSYRRKNANLCITSTEGVMLAVMRYDAKILKKQSF